MLKREITERDRLSLGEFVAVFADALGQYARRCERDLVFAVKAEIPKDVWKEAYAWAKGNLTLAEKTTKDGNTTFYRIKHAEHVRKQCRRSGWTTLEQIKEYYRSECTVSKKETAASWIDAVCSCQNFQKMYVCLHVVGVATRKRDVDTPDYVKNAPIESRRPRGRPALAKSAYVVQ